MSSSLSVVEQLDLGREVRRRRAELGLSLVALAKRAHLTPNFIGNVELGKINPALSTLLAIADGLRVPLGQLLGGQMQLGADASKVGRLLKSAPPELQEGVLYMLRAITKGR